MGADMHIRKLPSLHMLSHAQDGNSRYAFFIYFVIAITNPPPDAMWMSSVVVDVTCWVLAL